MATSIDLEELSKEIEGDRKRLADKEAVLRYLQEIEGKSHPAQQGNSPESLVSGIIN